MSWALTIQSTGRKPANAGSRRLLQALDHMDDNDRLSPEDFPAIYTAVTRMRRRSLFAAVVGGFLFSVLCGVLMYFVPKASTGFLALALGFSTWLVFGLPLTLYWLRHWRSIDKQLHVVERQVRAGEAVYGSRAIFHGRMV